MDVLAADARQQLLGAPPLGALVDQAEAARRVGDADVVGDRQVGQQRQLLEDAHDPGAGGLERRGERDVPALEEHGALGGLHDPGHDLDQRRLAGAVLAEHGVDAAALAGEIDPSSARTPP